MVRYPMGKFRSWVQLMSEVGNPFAVLCPVSSYYTNLSLHSVLPSLSHPLHHFTGYTKYASHKLNQVKYFFLTAKHESKHSKLTQGQLTPSFSSSFPSYSPFSLSIHLLPNYKVCSSSFFPAKIYC